MSKIDNINQLINSLEHGQFNVDASDDLKQILSTLEGIIRNGQKRASADMTIKLSFKAENDVIEVFAASTIKLPKKARDRSLFFAGENGCLHTDNPRQENLPFDAITGGKQQVVNNY